MDEYADLEIILKRWDAENYRVELRFTQPDSEVDILSSTDRPSLVRFHLDELRRLNLDSAAYGKLLWQDVFADEALRILFAQARSNARSNKRILRLRLFIDTAPELHALHWETLRDPNDDTSLVTSEWILFSRYLSSQDWRPVESHPQRNLRALVCIANPNNLTEYQLTPFSVADELSRVQTSLGEIPVTPLASPGSATLSHLNDKLREGFDILYLVCHGRVIGGESKLYLEDEQGKVKVVGGMELIARFNELQTLPRLVVLASCQSANMQDSTNGALATLGPRLAASGVPAVMAMQGNISITTIETFMPTFFKELCQDGQIDRAMAVARGAVRDRLDSWMPVLFLRLRSGRIWYEPGFQKSFEKWPIVIDAIRGDPINPELGSRCIPIIGSGFIESLLGSPGEIAESWAKKFNFPLADFNRDNLPQVAQFLAVNQQPLSPREGLAKYWRSRLLEQLGAQSTPEQKSLPLSQLMIKAAQQKWNDQPTEPNRVLANMPFDIYITTNPDNLLNEALKAAGKDPQVELCRWNERIRSKSIYDQKPDYRPTVQQPLIYCLFGQMDDLNSLVLTEDDYFDFLIAVMRKEKSLPVVVRTALAERLLLFLGFQLNDWTFRVPFRYIMNQEGGDLRENFTHIAAQIAPNESHMKEPQRAQDYLEKYFADARFHKDVSISVYWGTVEDFVKDLYQEWQTIS